MHVTNPEFYFYLQYYGDKKMDIVYGRLIYNEKMYTTKESRSGL